MTNLNDPTRGTVTVVLTCFEARAVDAVLAGFDGSECFDHDPDEHGDESECFGYGPQTIAAIESAHYKIGTAKCPQ